MSSRYLIAHFLLLACLGGFFAAWIIAVVRRPKRYEPPPYLRATNGKRGLPSRDTR